MLTLTEIAEIDINDIYAKGYHWCKHYFWEPLWVWEKGADKDPALGEELWTMACHIHEFNHAPRAAIAAIQRAIGYAPTDAILRAMLAKQQYELGDYKMALDNINLALNLDSEEPAIHHYRQMIQDALNYNHQALFYEDHPTHKYNEALARGEFEWVKSDISLHIDTLSEQTACLMRAAAVTGDRQMYFKCRFFLYTDSWGYEPELADQFYRPLSHQTKAQAMQVRNPRTGENDYTLAVNDAKQVGLWANELRQAQPQWQAMGVEERVRIMHNWLNNLTQEKAALQEQLAIDTGRNSVATIEVESVLGLIRGWLYRAPQLLQTPTQRPSASSTTVMIEQQWVPYPVVGVISPWNFPMLLALIDTIPALLAGCAVLLKPSEVTPRFMDPLEESLRTVPELAAVLQLARGGAETGKAIVNTADAICFTGSVPTGQAIAATCAQRFIPAFLELGGKDPALVLADADVERASDAILRSCVGATGQACQSLERVYVHDSIANAFIESLVAKAEKVELSTNPDQGQLGPIIFAAQAQKIQQQIDEAVAAGARILTGGKVENINGGLWCRPTVLMNVTHGMAVMNKETFGPLIPIMTFGTEKEAIHLANDSQYGLSASVFSTNQESALRVAYQLEAGAISINDGGLTTKVFDAEKNSFKFSGINASRMGDAGFLRFFRKKAMLIQTATPDTMAIFQEKTKL